MEGEKVRIWKYFTMHLFCLCNVHAHAKICCEMIGAGIISTYRTTMQRRSRAVMYILMYTGFEACDTRMWLHVPMSLTLTVILFVFVL